MKRTPLKRKSRLRSGSVLPKRNRKRAAQRRARDFGDYAEWIRTQPCCIAEPPNEDALPWEFPGLAALQTRHAAHVRSRGAGGRAMGNLVPLCWWHHREQHAMGIKSFQKKYKIDLSGVASALAARYAEETEK